MSYIKNHIELETLVSIDDFVNTYERTHRAAPAVDFLCKQEVLPLTYTSPKLAYLNILGSYVYLSGTMTYVKGAEICANITGTIPGQKKLQKMCKQYLDLEFTSQTNGISFGNNGKAYIRLLHLLGYHTNTNPDRSNKHTKASIGSTFPPFILHLLKHYDELNNYMQLLSRRYFADILTVYFDTRARKASSTSQNLSLQNQPDMRKLMRSARQVVDMSNIVYPRLGLTKDSIDPFWTGVPKSATGNILYELKHVARMQRKRRSPLKIEIKIDPVFSFELARK